MIIVMRKEYERKPHHMCLGRLKFYMHTLNTISDPGVKLVKLEIFVLEIYSNLKNWFKNSVMYNMHVL